MAEYGLARYHPNLPDGYNVPAEVGADPGFNLNAMKRPKFHLTIRDALEAAVESMIGTDPDGNGLLFYRCGSCGLWGEGQSMHLGHKINWKDYLTSKQPLNKRAAILAYNDLSNLHFEHGVCNTSHAFENSAITAPGEAILKFEELATRYKVKSVPLGVALLLSSEYELLLAAPTVGHRSAKLYSTKFPRPKYFDKSTRSGLISIWKGSGLIKEGFTPDNRKLDLYKCGSCGNWGEGFSMQLGHIENWGSYIAKTAGLEVSDTATIAEAQWAYNDLNNLKFEHPTCNSGHEWEEHDGSDPDFLPDQQARQEIQDFLAKNRADARVNLEEIAGALDVEWEALFKSDEEAQDFDRRSGKLIASAILIELESAGEKALFDRYGGSIPRSQVTGSTGDHFSSEPVREAYIKSEVMKSELVGLVLKAIKMSPSEISLSRPLLTEMAKVRDPRRGLKDDVANQFHLEVDGFFPDGVGKTELAMILGRTNAQELGGEIDQAEVTSNEITRSECAKYKRDVIGPIVERFNETWQDFIGQAITAEELENFKRALETPAAEFTGLSLCGKFLEPVTIKRSCAGFANLAASAIGVSPSEVAVHWISSLPLLRK